MDVYHKLQRLAPTTDNLVVPAKHAEADNVRLRSRAVLEAMPWFPWDQIYSDRAKKMAARTF